MDIAVTTHGKVIGFERGVTAGTRYRVVEGMIRKPVVATRVCASHWPLAGELTPMVDVAIRPCFDALFGAVMFDFVHFACKYGALKLGLTVSAFFVLQIDIDLFDGGPEIGTARVSPRVHILLRPGLSLSEPPAIGLANPFEQLPLGDGITDHCLAPFSSPRDEGLPEANDAGIPLAINFIYASDAFESPFTALAAS